ncbi:hypothetical protein M422DRAFT_252374 [Sphaerobolus stellatus SS14]|uniref:Uncharacterized protein n=1 Tax=Sphaerobolus stellatus (strain SS14) TaxID=990650 RepID=A0A0C9UN10_SPHS4|nr:hypothetical protein M422DRAFT_252374 [Sphaerobolus stellatus SS14]
MLDSTGPAFRKYIARALASRAAEDDERDVAITDTLSRLEAVRKDVPASPRSTVSTPRRGSIVSENDDPKLSRLHDIFGYNARSNRSSVGSTSTPTSTSKVGATSSFSPNVEQADAIIAQLSSLRGDNQ